MRDRRQYETERKREYRLKQHFKKGRMAAEVVVLEAQLKECLARKAETTALENDSSGGAALLRVTGQSMAELGKNIDLNNHLRMHVQRQRHLVQLLQDWVTRNTPLESAMKQSSPWLHSTLLAEPSARDRGYRWLTDRIYYSTPLSLSFSGKVDDAMQLNLVTDGDSVLGMDTYCQTTTLANFKAVADCIWAGYNRNDVLLPYHTTTTFIIDESIMYKRFYDSKIGTSLLELIRRYDEPGRVVLVTCWLREDACYPLQASEMRPHGVGWKIFERIASDITLRRERSIQYSPETTDGVVSAAQMAAMFGVEAHPTSSDVTLARIESSATRNFEQRCLEAIAALNARLDV
ncbi:Aste57867_20506 [Aphanomyces stellatus]|uniref:Aste57867_20506 protein n=1 Tax=Aphanomyces stellatus TaxID=120398 RepID=A0A485LFU2_9STRA|nr:hypothetical protein As57867_020440 [Aphanomyces stellatus]VFT97191.1 Aste57867_20506 [Aphanomyces stellatus]